MEKRNVSLLDLEQKVARRGSPIAASYGHSPQPRGRTSHHKPGCGIANLEQDVQNNHNRRRAVRAQSFDFGERLSVETAHGRFPLETETIGQAYMLPEATMFSAYADSYDVVEGFEDFTAQVGAPSVEDVHAAPAAPGETEGPPAEAEQPTLAPVTAEPPATGDAQETAPPPPPPPPEGGEVAQVPADEGAPLQAPADEATPAQWPAKLVGAGDAISPTTPKPAIEAEAIDNDIRMILDKNKGTEPPVETQPILTKPQPQPGEAPIDEPKLAAQAGDTENPHAIFDKIAQSMTASNTFDMGQYNLAQRLSDIDSQVAQEEQQRSNDVVARSFSDAAALNNDDMLHDIAAISSLLEDKLKEEKGGQGSAPRGPSAKQPAAPDVQAIPAPQKGAVPAPPATVKPPKLAADVPAAATPASDTVAPSADDAAPISPPAEATPTVAPAPADASPTQAPAAVSPEEGSSAAEPQANDFDVSYTVPAAASNEAVSAQAAAAAMLLAWRDQRPIDMQALASGEGAWQPYKDHLQGQGENFYSGWELMLESPAPLTPERLQTLLKERGPVWLQSVGNNALVRVVTGISGDGTTASMVSVIDPAAGVAAVSAAPAPQSINFAEFTSGLGETRVATLIQEPAEQTNAEEQDNG